MDDDSVTAIDHAGHERPVETNGGKQILGNRMVPLIVVKDGKSAARRR
jgi:hypothetical protein